MPDIPTELVAWVTAAGGLFGSGWLAAVRIVADPLKKRLDIAEAEQRVISATLIERWLNGSSPPSV